jgi:hypothetical protein
VETPEHLRLAQRIPHAERQVLRLACCWFYVLSCSWIDGQEGAEDRKMRVDRPDLRSAKVVMLYCVVTLCTSTPPRHTDTREVSKFCASSSAPAHSPSRSLKLHHSGMREGLTRSMRPALSLRECSVLSLRGGGLGVDGEGGEAPVDAESGNYSLVLKQRAHVEKALMRVIPASDLIAGPFKALLYDSHWRDILALSMPASELVRRPHPCFLSFAISPQLFHVFPTVIFHCVWLPNCAMLSQLCFCSPTGLFLPNCVIAPQLCNFSLLNHII